MPYAIPYNHPAAIPVGILLVYVILFIVQLFSKYATLFWTEGTQQADLAIQKDASPIESTSKGSKGLNELVRPDRTSTKKSSVSRGDSAINNTKSTDANNFNTTGTGSPSTQNQDSQEHFCMEVSQSGDGTTTQSSEG